jgi:hypothetical protein
VSLNYEIIELASEGYFYPNGHPLSTGRVSIYPITAKQEDLLANSNFARLGILDKEFLNEVIVGGIDYNSLLKCDRDSILLNLRIANYGPVAKTKYKCESCEQSHEGDISFAFRSVNFDFSKYERGINRLSYTFPRSKKTVYFKLPTCSEQKIYDEYGWLTFIKCMTSEIEDVQKDSIEDFYDNRLGAVDSNNFRSYYNKNMPGYINEVSFTCPACSFSKKSKIEVGLDIFGINSEAKMNIHSEIFDLCYYSNGAFTQDVVYNMPTMLRTFYIKKLVEAKKAEADAQKNASKGSANNKISRPAISKNG